MPLWEFEPEILVEKRFGLEKKYAPAGLVFFWDLTDVEQSHAAISGNSKTYVYREKRYLNLHFHSAQ